MLTLTLTCLTFARLLSPEAGSLFAEPLLAKSGSRFAEALPVRTAVQFSGLPGLSPACFWLLCFVLLAGAACLFYGFFIEVNRFRVRELELHLEGLRPEQPGLDEQRSDGLRPDEFCPDRLCMDGGYREELSQNGLYTEGDSQSWESLQLLYFSDLHLGPGMPRKRLQKLISLMLEEEPELILFGGDMLEHGERFGERELALWTRELSKLKPRLGFYAVKGNHDSESPEAAAFLEKLYAQLGVRLLSNEAVDLGGLILVGLDEAMNGRPDLAAALSTLCSGDSSENSGGHSSRENSETFPGFVTETAAEKKKPGRKQDADAAFFTPSSAAAAHNPPLLILEHCPDVVPTFAETGRAELWLAGHSHHGQIRPFGLHLYKEKLGRDYPYGLYQLGEKKQLYTSCGVGTVGIHARFGAAPEIIRLKLRSSTPQQECRFRQ